MDIRTLEACYAFLQTATVAGLEHVGLAAPHHIVARAPVAREGYELGSCQ